MATFTAEQLKQKYGGVLASSTTSSTPTNPGNAFSRVIDTIARRGENVEQAISGTGQYSGQSPIRRGLSATAEAFSAVPEVALEASPGFVREPLKAAGEVIGQGFSALTDRIASTKLFKEIGELEAQGYLTPDTAPELFRLKESLGGTAAAGEIAGNIAGAKGTSQTLRVGTDLARNVAGQGLSQAKNIASKGAGIVKDITPTSQRVINDQITKALDLTQGDLNNIYQSTGNELGVWISKHNLIGDNKDLTQKNIKDFTDQNYKAVRQEIDKVTDTYKPYQVPRYVDALKQILSKVQGVAGLEKISVEVQNLLKKQDIKLADVQRVKELMDDHFNLYKVTGEVGEGRAKEGLANIRKDIQTFIEDQVKNKTGADIKGMNNNVQTGYNILDAIDNRMQRGLTRSNIKLGDWGTFVATTGITGGNFLAGLAVVLGKKALETPAARLRIAKWFDSQSDKRKQRILNQVQEGKIPEELKPFIKK